jgi:hypothetical protein
MRFTGRGENGVNFLRGTGVFGVLRPVVNFIGITARDP